MRVVIDTNCLLLSIADLAISANVNYLVTEDKHFNVLKTLPFPTVKVVNLKEFKGIIDF